MMCIAIYTYYNKSHEKKSTKNQILVFNEQKSLDFDTFHLIIMHFNWIQMRQSVLSFL